MSQRNIETVQQIYAAFGRGDIPAILERLRDDVSWEDGVPDHGIPWLTPGKGRAAAAAFFQALTGADFSLFEVVAVLGEGDLVVGVVNVEFTVRATGKKVRERGETHLWRFDAQGRVAAMRHGADTHQHWLATRP